MSLWPCAIARQLRGVVLDTLLGPAEKIEYVSTTAPASPPPTSS